MASMNALEKVRIKPFLQRGDRLVQQIAARADMKPHIVAFSLNAVDIKCRNPDQFGAVRNPNSFGKAVTIGLRTNRQIRFHTRAA